MIPADDSSQLHDLFLGSCIPHQHFSGLFLLRDTRGYRRGKIPWQRRWQQYWFNFIGSLSGWIAIWFVAQKLWASNLGQWRLADFGLAVVGFIGITGYLPYTVIGVINAVWELAKKVLERAVDVATKG